MKLHVCITLAAGFMLATAERAACEFKSSTHSPSFTPSQHPPQMPSDL
jgi:hypothetical protein